MVAFRVEGPRDGMAVARAELGRWRKSAATGVAAFGLAAAGGCSCETDFRLLQGEIESCFEAEWRCCQRIAESDPDEGVACFGELRERRRRLSEMLFLWLDACRSSERDLARELGRSIRGLLMAGRCEDGPVRTMPDGRTVTVGLPFSASDTISLRWDLPSAGRGGRSEARLSGRSVPIRIGDREVPVFASGRLAISVDRSARIGPRIEAFELDLAVGTGPDGSAQPPGVRLRLAVDERFPARHFVRDGRERLGFLVEVEQGREPWPLPRFLWMEWPLARSGDAITVGGDRMPMHDLMPPDPGIADWNGDGRVDPADLAEFLATPEARRDLDLDGTGDEKDVTRFLELWRERCERIAP